MARILKVLLLSTALVSAAGFTAWQGTRVHAALSGETEAQTERSGRGGGRGGQRGSAAAQVEIATAEIEAMAPISIAYGQISAPRRVEIISGAAGKVVFVSPELQDGALVGQGDVLFRIDDTDAVATLREAEIALRSAEVVLRNSKRRVDELNEEKAFLDEKLVIAQGELERTKPLVDRGLSGIATLEAARSAELSARQSLSAQNAAISTAEDTVVQNEIAVEQAQLAVERAQRAMHEHEVTAAIAGEFSGDTPVRGQEIAAAVIGKIVDISALEVRLDLSQAALSRITGSDGRAKALSVEIRRPSGNVRAKAVIERIAIETGTEGGENTIAIARILPGDAALLRPGDFVEAKILEDVADEVVALPASAVSPDARVVFVGDDGAAVFETVEIIRRIDDKVYLSAAHAGRSFVVKPPTEISEGQALAGNPAPEVHSGAPEGRAEARDARGGRPGDGAQRGAQRATGDKATEAGPRPSTGSEG